MSSERSESSELSSQQPQEEQQQQGGALPFTVAEDDPEANEVTLEEAINEYLAEEDSEKFFRDYNLTGAKFTAFLGSLDDEDLEDAAPEDPEERKALIKEKIEEYMFPFGLKEKPDESLVHEIGKFRDDWEAGDTELGNQLIFQFDAHCAIFLRSVAIAIGIKEGIIDPAAAAKLDVDDEARHGGGKKKKKNAAPPKVVYTPAELVGTGLAIFSAMYSDIYWMRDNEQPEAIPDIISKLNTAVYGLLKNFDDEELGFVGDSRSSLEQGLIAKAKSVYEAMEDILPVEFKAYAGSIESLKQIVQLMGMACKVTAEMEKKKGAKKVKKQQDETTAAAAAEEVNTKKKKRNEKTSSSSVGGSGGDELQKKRKKK